LLQMKVALKFMISSDNLRNYIIWEIKILSGLQFLFSSNIICCYDVLFYEEEQNVVLVLELCERTLQEELDDYAKYLEGKDIKNVMI
jgi:hypothetical protein